MLKRGDLHIHSTASDGYLTPSEIILTAKSLGVDTIAIADHNSTEGILEAATVGNRYGVTVIPAVELSTKYKGESIHVLGYFCDNSFCDINLLEALKYVRNHKFNNTRRLLQGILYSDKSNGPLSLAEGILLLKTFRAAVVLAHPVRISKNNLPEVLSFPFDGIEAKYCHNSPQDTFFFINLAIKHFSFYSGGSDFHGNRGYHKTHCNLGNPCLNEFEIQSFLSNSGAIYF